MWAGFEEAGREHEAECKWEIAFGLQELQKGAVRETREDGYSTSTS